MPCYQSNPVGVIKNPGTFATEAECLQACKEGACCESNGTCSVKPQCQCQGAGQTFRGVGTTCTPDDCKCVSCTISSLFQTSTIATLEIAISQWDNKLDVAPYCLPYYQQWESFLRSTIVGIHTLQKTTTFGQYAFASAQQTNTNTNTLFTPRQFTVTLGSLATPCVAPSEPVVNVSFVATARQIANENNCHYCVGAANPVTGVQPFTPNPGGNGNVQEDCWKNQLGYDLNVFRTVQTTFAQVRLCQKTAVADGLWLMYPGNNGLNYCCRHATVNGTFRVSFNNPLP